MVCIKEREGGTNLLFLAFSREMAEAVALVALVTASVVATSRSSGGVVHLVALTGIMPPSVAFVACRHCV